jgi:hypothetical protein
MDRLSVGVVQLKSCLNWIVTMIHNPFVTSVGMNLSRGRNMFLPVRWCNVVFFCFQFLFVFLRFMLPQWTGVTCGHVTCLTIGYVCWLFNWKVVFSIIVLVVVVGIAITSRSPVSKGTCPFWLKRFGDLDLQVTSRRHGRSKIAIDGTPMHLWPTMKTQGKGVWGTLDSWGTGSCQGGSHSKSI